MSKCGELGGIHISDAELLKSIEKRNAEDDRQAAKDDELARYQQALGLLTTLAPSMEMDAADPLGMAKTVEKTVQDKLSRSREHIYQLIKLSIESTPKSVLMYMRRIQREYKDERLDELLTKHGPSFFSILREES